MSSVEDNVLLLVGERSSFRNKMGSCFFTGDDKSRIFSSFLGDETGDSILGSFCTGGIIGRGESGTMGICEIGEVSNCILDKDCRGKLASDL